MGRYDLYDQRAFAARQSVYALSDAVRIVHVTGPDALKLLSALTTLMPQTEPAPDGTQALALDGQGHIVFGITVVPGDGALTLLTDGSPEALAGLLNSRRFRLRAEAAPRPDLKVLIVPAQVDGLGRDGARHGGTGYVVAVDSWPQAAGSAQLPGDGAGDSHHKWPRYALDSPHPGVSWTGSTAYAYHLDASFPLPDQLESMGYRRIDGASLEALRIAAWRPLASREAADGKTLPHELDWLRTTTALNSGCYPGQETVAKIINAGKPPRRLVFLHLDGSDAVLPDAGAAVYADPRADVSAGAGVGPGSSVVFEAGHSATRRPTSAVGRITSAGMHFELGPIALALVKRSLPETASLRVAAPGAPGQMIAASQTTIVPSSGESDARPVRRLAPPRLALRRRG
jgi:folate-binding protein YgfZ